jgi:peptide deformylase
VTDFDSRLHRLVRDLIDTMKARDGAGLAAIQIGEPQRVVVLDNDDDPPIVMVNPEITWRSGETAEAVEACLSFPGVAVKVLRDLDVRVKFDDEHGVLHELQAADDFFARAIQHELDHLDGRLLVDYGAPYPTAKPKKRK